MERVLRKFLPIAAIFVSAGHVAAQSSTSPSTAFVNKTSTAVTYTVDKGDTKVDLKATGTIPDTKGEAKVEAKQGITLIEAKVEKLYPPGKISTQFLTYVLWAIAPDGHANNLGEMVISDDGKSELKVTTQLQSFALIVTAEPYYSVRQPSEIIVLENEARQDTKGRVVSISGYKLTKRDEYEKSYNPLSLSLDTKNVPLVMYQARNAVNIAKSRSADKFAPEIYSKADDNLKIAEDLLERKADKKEVISAARQAVQLSEDARVAATERAAQKQEQERIASEQAAAAQKARADAEAKAAAEAAAAKRLADQEAQRLAQLAAANEAQLQAQAKAQADALAAEANRAQAEANAAQAKEAAARAEAERARKAAEASRAELLEQLNRVLDTRDTPRGLVVNMADVLFDSGKYDLRPEAREKLAKLSGILSTHQGLELTIEGHTDNTGGVQLNQALSDQRAQSVAQYLVEQGVPGKNVKSKGFADAQPVADNSTAEGRQKNRRVEIIVSGEAIGTTIGKGSSVTSR